MAIPVTTWFSKFRLPAVLDNRYSVLLETLCGPSRCRRGLAFRHARYVVLGITDLWKLLEIPSGQLLQNVRHIQSANAQARAYFEGFIVGEREV